MHKITFYPLGNADSSLIELENGQNILFDYAHVKCSEDEEDLRIDLKTNILEKMEEKGKDNFDVVAFSHADEDHYQGFSDILFLKHANKYQEGFRLKINELWIPAAVVVETGLKSEGKILQAEARHRIKEKTGIKVFSRPEALKDWFDKEGLDINHFRHLFVDAGKLVPGFNIDENNVEIFVHSPFAIIEDSKHVDRNLNSIVVQFTFSVNAQITRVIMSADTHYGNWQSIVNITKNKNRSERLNWDIFKIPHHCSYNSLGPEKGSTKTIPVEEVSWLLEQGNNRLKIISTSNPIKNEESDQPPHFQAKNCYKDFTGIKDGEFLVTMEFPREASPQPLEIEIDESGASTIKRNIGSAVLISKPARRAG